MKHTEWYWKMFLISQISKFTWEMHMIRNFLGKGGATKSDEFSEKLQGGGGHFQSKNLYCRFLEL